MTSTWHDLLEHFRINVGGYSENQDTTNVSHCAIIGSDGSTWANVELSLTRGEILLLRRLLNNPDSEIIANGVGIGDRKFVIIQMNLLVEFSGMKHV